MSHFDLILDNLAGIDFLSMLRKTNLKLNGIREHLGSALIYMTSIKNHEYAQFTLCIDDTDVSYLGMTFSDYVWNTISRFEKKEDNNVLLR